MKISISTKSPAWTKFEKEEWKVADLKHYGQTPNWKKTKFKIAATNNRKNIGVLRMEVQNGVAYVEALIVGQKVRGKGIGKELLLIAEKVAIENGAHKIYLQTGKSWDSVDFYTRTGYVISGEFPNHYFHADFIVMSKFLK